MKMVKIAYSGASGTGKTTCAFKEVVQQKILHPDKKVGILCEVARGCPYPINQHSSRLSQMWIFIKQLEAEHLKKEEGYDILVCDRTVVDSIAYTIYRGFLDEAKVMMQMVKEKPCNSYNRIIVNTVVNNPYNYNDGLRYTSDPSFRIGMESILLDLYKQLGWEVEKM